MNHPPDAPSTKSRNVPWTWAAGLILAAVAGVGYVVVAPILEHEASHRMPRNETAVVAALRQIVRVEVLPLSADKNPENDPVSYWTVDLTGLRRPEFVDRMGEPTIDDSLAAADRFPDRTANNPPVKPGPPAARHGYFFEALLNDEDGKPYANAADKDGKLRLNWKMKFGFRATPEIYGKTGRLTFQVNQEGIIYSKDLGCGAEADPPRASWQGGTDPTKDGWRAVD